MSHRQLYLASFSEGGMDDMKVLYEAGLRRMVIEIA